MPRRLFLVRHGETEGQSSIRFHGRGDVPLSEVGREQARRVARHLARERIPVCYHSPLTRAVESARLIAQAHGTAMSLTAVADLREIDFGSAEGLTMDEIRARDPAFAARWESGEIERYPGGDSIAEFRARAAAAARSALTRDPDQDVLIVAHRGVLLAVLHGLVPGHGGILRRFVTDLGSVHRLEEHADGWRVTAWNEVPR